MNAPPSIAHSNAEPASSAVKAKVGVGSLIAEPSAGPPVMVVFGGVVSTVNVRTTGDGSAFPARSIARTLSVCGPSVSEAKVCGVEQGANAPASIRHWNEPGLVRGEVEGRRAVRDRAAVRRAARDRGARRGDVDREGALLRGRVGVAVAVEGADREGVRRLGKRADRQWRRAGSECAAVDRALEAAARPVRREPERGRRVVCEAPRRPGRC